MNYTTQFTFFKMIKNATIAPSLIGLSVWGQHTTSTYNHNILREANFWLIIQILIKIIAICFIFIYNPENSLKLFRSCWLLGPFPPSLALQGFFGLFRSFQGFLGLPSPSLAFQGLFRSC